jgi:hypothetical protein
MVLDTQDAYGFKLNHCRGLIPAIVTVVLIVRVPTNAPCSQIKSDS